MYQVTAIYEGVELSYGVGDSKEYAIEECLDGIESMYLDNLIDIMLNIFHNETVKTVNSVEYYYKERQYF